MPMIRDDLFTRLLAYHEAHGCWGPLRPAFDEGDLHNTGLVLCRSHARARADAEAHALLDALFGMQEVRRRILRREVMEALFAKAEAERAAVSTPPEVEPVAVISGRPSRRVRRRQEDAAAEE